MTNLYIRWGGVCIVAIVLIVLTYNHYRDNLASLVPQQVRQESPKGDIRVLGMVQGGTLETRGAGESHVHPAWGDTPRFRCSMKDRHPITSGN